MYNVNCMMCGRSSGQLRHGVFVRQPNAPALVHTNGRNRCGYCGGNLYLEPDDTILSQSSAEALGGRRRKLAS
jgi:hypothetical protein